MLKEFGNINGYLLRDTFEILTISKIKYCGEFCLDDNLQNLNKIQYQFYKRFCHLKVTTPNYCLVGEFGIKPIQFYFYRAALRYWAKIITSDENSLTHKIYKQIYNNITEPLYSKTWVCQIKRLLHKLQLEDLWRNQSEANRKIYKTLVDIRLSAYFREQWIDSAKHSQKGKNYLELARFEPNLKPYLNFIVNNKSISHMLKIRTCNHSLSVEVDRYKNRKTYKECICKSCDLDQIEDLFHVIIKCPKYSASRDELLAYMTDVKEKPDLFAIMNKLTAKEIKRLSDFMAIVEDQRINK